MTLSPVFRSHAAVRLLEEQGVWRRLAPDVQGQADAVRTLYADLREVLGSEFRAAEPHVPDAAEALAPAGLHFVQEYFFLILFRSIFASLGVGAERLRLYSELNFCIKGTITAADNLFDDQDKSLLPLAPVSGARFRSILQLLAFERLLRRALDRGQHARLLDGAQRDAVLRGLLDRMASIGRLEGSEEGGVDEVPTPEEMVERVHRVRGGALFALAFAAPSVLEDGDTAVKFAAAEPAVARLGTAFQIVDDLTDFEFDLGRRSHNLLTSQAFHHGTGAEKAALARFRGGEPVAPGAVESLFRGSARAVLERAYEEARASFRALAELGHWLEPAMADEVVHAIVGLDGVARMEALTSRG
ncbi:MAG TPA: class 1 isoprenoid biosynthesis enzyme [Longimicrobiales bacterium]|nr:class 1 isoprenoid biosynthesis enzyme [Longimicrobiales bacterium]